MKTKKIVFYLRSSDDKQNYEYQLNNLNSHLAHFNNIELDHVFVEKISTNNLEKNRLEMKSMLESVSKGEIDEIWVNEMTSLSIEAEDLQQIVIFCVEHKVNIFFKKQNLNTLDEAKNYNPFTQLIISILTDYTKKNIDKYRG